MTLRLSVSFGYFPPRNTRRLVRHPISSFVDWVLGQDNLLKRMHVEDTFRHIDPQPKDHLLEIGAAGLYYAGELAKQVKRCVALDYFAGFERQLDERRFPPSLQLVRADAHCLPFRGDEFDKVFVSELFSVLTAPDRCAAEILRVLKPGGRVTTVHGNVFFDMREVMQEAASRRLLRLAKHRWGAPDDFRAFTNQFFSTHGTNPGFFEDRNGTIRALLERAGFRDLRMTWSVGKSARLFYCRLLLRALAKTGRPVLGAGQVLYLPYLKTLERRDPASSDGLTLICSATKP
jgi:ubiquinone/menaquinone biosynthesis C-methylase UbiE